MKLFPIRRLLPLDVLSTGGIEDPSCQDSKPNSKRPHAAVLASGNSAGGSRVRPSAETVEEAAGGNSASSFHYRQLINAGYVTSEAMRERAVVKMRTTRRTGSVERRRQMEFENKDAYRSGDMSDHL